MKLRLLLSIMTLFVASVPGLTAEDTPPSRAAIDAYMNDLAEHGFVGIIGISGPDGIIHMQGFGDAVPGKEAYTGATPVDIASVTKQFTGAAILKLAEEGKLSLSDTLARFFPGVPDDKAGITLHQLLTHTAGLADVIGPDEEPITRASYLERAFATPLQHKAGDRYHYSNMGFSLLAAVIEVASEQTYEHYLQEAFWAPLGMSQTGYFLSQWTSPTPSRHTPYNGMHSIREMLDSTGGDAWNLFGNGGLISTAEDMLRWHRASLDDSVLSDRSRELLFAPHVPEDADGVYHYGYGWSVVPNYGGKKLVWHNGGSPFIRSEFWRFPQSGTAFFIASNGGNVETYTVADGLALILLGRTPQPLKP